MFKYYKSWLDNNSRKPVFSSSTKDITAFSILGPAGIIGANTINKTVPDGTSPIGVRPQPRPELIPDF